MKVETISSKEIQFRNSYNWRTFIKYLYYNLIEWLKSILYYQISSINSASGVVITVSKFPISDVSKNGTKS